MRTTTAAAACCSLLLAAVAPGTAVQRDAAEVSAAFNYRGSKPNIIIVYADDLGSGDLGFYGHPTSSTPNLNTFIMEGARMTQYYSPAAICSPSRGSLMTGRLFPRLGIYPGVLSPLSKGGLPTSEVTIAAGLKRAGYATGGLGKWHLGTQEYLPTNHGFDYYFGAPMTQNECYSNIHFPGSTPPTGQFGPCPLFNGTDGKIWRQSNGTYPADPNAVDMLNVDELYDAAAAAFIRNATDAGLPFFFYFASHHTHAPQFAGDALLNSTERGLFGDSLATLDRSVGRLLSVLREEGIDNSTLVIFSADNGGSLHWHELGGVNGAFRCGKGTTWEGGQRVPSMVRWPGVVPAGVAKTGLASSLDWFPTAMALAGVPREPTDAVSDGYDLSDYLFGGSSVSPRSTFFYHATKASLPNGGLMAVRSGAFKLHFYTQGSHCTSDYYDQACWDATGLANLTSHPLLFNLEVDPGEVNPIPSGPEYNAIVANLTAIAAQHMANFTVAPSETSKGSSPERFPCCSPECEPKPHCCRCE